MEKTTFRKHSRETWTTVCNETVRDSKISFKATGLLVYLLSMSDVWKVRQGQLAEAKTDGKESIGSAMKELQEAGYLKKEILRENGRMVGVVWHVYEDGIQSAEASPIPEKPFPDFPETENPPLRKNNLKERTKEEAPSLFSDENENESEKTSKERKAMEKEIPFLSLFDVQAINALLSVQGFGESWRDFVGNRAEMRNKLTQRAAKILLLRCSEKPSEAPAALRACIEKGWRSFEWEWLAPRKAFGGISANTPTVKPKAVIRDMREEQEKRMQRKRDQDAGKATIDLI
jgi:hypothetical protein